MWPASGKGLFKIFAETTKEVRFCSIFWFSVYLKIHAFGFILLSVHFSHALSQQVTGKAPAGPPMWQFGFHKETIIPHTSGTGHWKASSKLPVRSYFTKAFNSVSHNSLLNTLYFLRTSHLLLLWIKTNLSKRVQRVVLNGQPSMHTWHPVSSCVHQGSNHGPLLFLSYTNDHTDSSLSISSRPLMFSDDLTSWHFNLMWTLPATGPGVTTYLSMWRKQNSSQSQL